MAQRPGGSGTAVFRSARSPLLQQLHSISKFPVSCPSGFLSFFFFGAIARQSGPWWALPAWVQDSRLAGCAALALFCACEAHAQASPATAASCQLPEPPAEPIFAEQRRRNALDIQSPSRYTDGDPSAALALLPSKGQPKTPPSSWILHGSSTDADCGFDVMHHHARWAGMNGTRH